ncbi:MAG: amino acid ABC transporter ATP-binding protein [Lautropia sp.]
MSAQPFIETRSLVKSFGPTPVLKGVDFALERGKTAAIIGPSGCGKSTFLRCLNLLETPTSGAIRIDETELSFENGKPVHGKLDVAAFRQRIGMVFQSFDLFPHMTALENVRIGLTSVKGIPKDRATEIALGALERVGMRPKADAHPRRLSGGQAQRVAIARAVAMDPKLLLFDEATSALDPELVGEVLAVIRDLVSEGRTMVLVTHEIEFALHVADLVVFLDQGRAVEYGPPEEILNAPRSERLREFLGRFSGAKTERRASRP